LKEGIGVQSRAEDVRAVFVEHDGEERATRSMLDEGGVEHGGSRGNAEDVAL
jgi:hypothetical protein